MQLLFCCWEHLAVDTEVVPAGNTDTLFRRSWAWGAASSLCGELRYFLCLYLSHYNTSKYATNFCLLTSICSAISALWLFSQHDGGPCFLSSKTTSSKLAGRLWWAVCCLYHWQGEWVSHTMALCWADGQYLVSLIYLKSAKLGSKCLSGWCFVCLWVTGNSTVSN